MELRILKGQQVIDSGLTEAIIDFDRKNMQFIFEKAGIDFPEEKRRKGLLSNPTFVIAFHDGAIAGYLEYLRSWNDPNYIYIGSVQIGEKYRHTELILKLFDEFRTSVSGDEFHGFETNVQKANTVAVRMYRKIGFKLEENPKNEASWGAKAGKELLTNSSIARLLDKWRKKHAGRGSTE